MPEWLPKVVHGGTLPLLEVVLRIVLAFLFGLLSVGVYWLSHRRMEAINRAFLATLVLLSVVIALVTLVIGDNIARAFSLVGALAIVRFRTVVEDTRDTAFVMFSVVVGMAAGAGYTIAPLLGTPFVLLAAWLFRPLPTPETPGLMTLILRLAAIQAPVERVTEVLQRRFPTCRLLSISTARGGAALDVTYAVSRPRPEQAPALVLELQGIEGVQGVELK